VFYVRVNHKKEQREANEQKNNTDSSAVQGREKKGGVKLKEGNPQGAGN